MQKVYSSENRLLVENAKNVLENAGIETALKNEFAGGGLGELAPIETWLELWVVEAVDAERAQRLLDEAMTQQGGDWRCNGCGEENAGSFDFCWNCGHAAG